MSEQGHSFGNLQAQSTQPSQQNELNWQSQQHKQEEQKPSPLAPQQQQFQFSNQQVDQQSGVIKQEGGEGENTVIKQEGDEEGMGTAIKHEGDAKSEQEVDAMKKRLKELEVESERLQAMQAELQKESADLAVEDKKDVDARSIYVGNVDYGTTPEELQTHFQSLGGSTIINRVTIVCDKYTGHPKGFAYIEFAEPAMVAKALVLNESVFRARALKIVPKRTNVPGFMLRGRGGRGNGSGFGGYRGRGMRGGGYNSRSGYRGGFRSRGHGMSPY